MGGRLAGARQGWVGLLLALALLLAGGCWGTGTGRVTHQVAFLEKADQRISLAVLVEFSPSHSYGTWTVRGVAKRLLKYVA